MRLKKKSFSCFTISKITTTKAYKEKKRLNNNF